MIIRVTGDERDVANSAWVSTLNEVRAQGKSDEEVRRVVQFLVDNHHTSPFESVTISLDLKIFSREPKEAEIFEAYSNNIYSRTTGDFAEDKKTTIDLLNFTKVTQKNNYWKEEPWILFKEKRPILAEMMEGFGEIPDTSSNNVEPELGEYHGMKVELVHLHDEDSDEHSRATWRVKCPLSIAVQILRHRTGSYNMVSGRYRTITQEPYSTPKDVNIIIEKAGLEEEGGQLNCISEDTIRMYSDFMKGLKLAKKNDKITNHEYKRVRECVRFVLPEGRMTELYVSYYLSDFYGNYKKLRDSIHAQKEHIWIAQEMERTLSEFRK